MPIKVLRTTSAALRQQLNVLRADWDCRQPHNAITRRNRHWYQAFIKKTTHLHRDPSVISRYIQLYNAGHRIYDIARRPDVNFSPYLLARIMVEEMECIPRANMAAVSKDPDIITDAKLRLQFIECMEKDTQCSPVVDKVKATAGSGGESSLQDGLTARGIPFANEESLRKLGFSKTPDVALDLPIGVASNDGKTAHIVQWIDSKAMFGDPVTHANHMEQFLGYVNRFGPGMVIYWHDYVDSLPGNTPNDIIITNKLPDEWIFPGCSTLSKHAASSAKE